MHEYENSYLSFGSPGKVAEFNADNRSIYDVYGRDNDICKKMGRSGNMYGTTRIPTGTHCPNPVTANASSITRLLQETSCSFPEIEKRH